jgi:hypothetical protein
MNKEAVRQEHKAYRGRAHIPGDRQPPKTGPAQEGHKMKTVQAEKKKEAKKKSFKKEARKEHKGA